MAIEVYRGGAKGRKLEQITAEVTVGPKPGKWSVANGYAFLRFFISSSGTGDTALSLHIKPEDFEMIAVTLMKVDREAAIKAFGHALTTVGADAAEPRSAVDGSGGEAGD